jgi:hypothetical protein
MHTTCFGLNGHPQVFKILILKGHCSLSAVVIVTCLSVFRPCVFLTKCVHERRFQRTLIRTYNSFSVRRAFILGRDFQKSFLYRRQQTNKQTNKLALACSTVVLGLTGLFDVRNNGSGTGGSAILLLLHTDLETCHRSNTGREPYVNYSDLYF